jgi:hypothetical protein
MDSNGGCWGWVVVRATMGGGEELPLSFVTFRAVIDERVRKSAA